MSTQSLAAKPAVSVGKQPRLADIDAFLAEKRLALVGVSRNPKDYSRLLMRELLQRGYDVVPVNPVAQEIEGRKSVARVQEIAPGLAAALLVTAPKTTESVVHDCIGAGVRFLWIRSAESATVPVLNLCRASGMRVVAGECPFMFLPNADFIHRFHGGLRKLVRTYPR